jgi:branched-chain amino acid transport system permease protein
MMDQSMIVQAGADALVLGTIYFVIASGFSLVFGITRILNFAHGELYMLGGFGTYYLYYKLHVPFILTVGLCMLTVALFSVVLDKAFFRHLRGQSIACLVLALGLVMIISTLSMISFGGTDRAVPPPYPGLAEFFGVRISIQRLIVMIVGIAMMIGLYWFVGHTKQGKAMRAVTTDSAVALLQGINVERIYSLSMFVGGALAGGAGALMAPVFYVNPFIGGPIIWKASIVITLGGMGSIPGALLGSFILSSIESFGHIFVGAYADILVFMLMMLILLIRPRGLLGLPFEIR